jgi:hypothetical protein
VAFTELDAEFFDEVVTREWHRPCGCVESGFLGRLMKCLDELLVLFVGEFGGSTLTWFVVDDLLERLVGEPFESVEPFRGPTTGNP